jgi:hypothetical protein
MVTDSNSLDHKILYLTDRIKGLKEKYERNYSKVTDLVSRLPKLDDLKDVIDSNSLKFYQSNYTTASDSLSYIDYKHTEFLGKEDDLDLLQASVSTDALKVLRTIEILISKSKEYKDTLSNIELKINAVSKLSISIDRNINACSLIYASAIKSFGLLKEKQTTSETYLKEYNKCLIDLDKFYANFTVKINIIEAEFDNFKSLYEEAVCYLNQKEEELTAIANSCDLSIGDLDYYYDLFIGSNYITAGDNIKLNRVGCAVVVHAYLPEPTECKKPPLIPPIASNITLEQAPLPKCPPPVCSTTPAPTTTTTTTTKAPTVPPKCNTQAKSGGAGVTVNNYNFEPWSGTVSVVYDMYSAKDKCDVYLDGILIRSTGTFVSGTGKLSFEYPGKGIIKVIMTGRDSGTVWVYNIMCD